MENFDTNVTWPEYTFVLPFERNVSPKLTQQWMEKNWQYSIYYSMVYVLVIFGIKRIMTNFKPFGLNKLLVVWNVMLAAFSILAFCRIVPEFTHVIQNHGIYQSVCVPRYVRAMQTIAVSSRLLRNTSNF